MDIYVAHPSSIDYENSLYPAIRELEGEIGHEFVLPHEGSDEIFDSRGFLEKKCDLMIAEVSEPSTGVGVELGWADLFDVPVLCIHREGADISGALSEVAEEIISYSSSNDVPKVIMEYLEAR